MVSILTAIYLIWLINSTLFDIFAPWQFVVISWTPVTVSGTLFLFL